MWGDKDGVFLRESARRWRSLPDGGEGGQGGSLQTHRDEGELVGFYVSGFILPEDITYIIL